MPTIQICPPAHDTNLEWPQAPHRPKYPVAVDYEAGEQVGNGIDFSILKFMQTSRGRDQTAGRRLATPRWAFPGADQRTLLARFMEYRAGFRYPQRGTEKERLERARRQLLASRSRLERTLDRLLAALHAGPPYHACSHGRGQRRTGRFISKRRLEAEIQNVDAQLCIENVAGTIARVIFLYYGCGFDSVGVGIAVGIRPPAVRQVLHKLHVLWRRMEAEAR